MKTLADCKRATFKQLVAGGAFFHGGKAYVPMQLRFRKIFREFEKRGQSWFFVGDGLASSSNYGHLLPRHELTEGV